MRQLLQRFLVFCVWLGVLWILWAPGWGTIAHGCPRERGKQGSKYEEFGFAGWYSISTSPVGFREKLHPGGLAFSVAGSTFASIWFIYLCRDFGLLRRSR